MPPGRPLKPSEVKRRNGNPGCRPLPDVSTVSVLPMATQAPEPPAELGVEGRRLWDRCWDAAITWLSPMSDVEAVVQVCHLVDDVTQALRRYRENGSTQDLHVLIAAQKMLHSALSGIGFDPAGRSNLGVAEGTARHGPGGPDVAPGAVSRRTTVAAWPPRVQTPVPAAALKRPTPSTRWTSSRRRAASPGLDRGRGRRTVEAAGLAA
jgi:hypothetical protein